MIHALLLIAGAHAAPQDAPKCPAIAVLSAPGKEAKTLWFLATVDPKRDSITYNWVVSAGTIESGQGTSQITVAADVGTFVTASVEVGGLDRACESFVSASDEIYPPAE